MVVWYHTVPHHHTIAPPMLDPAGHSDHDNHPTTEEDLLKEIEALRTRHADLVTQRRRVQDQRRRLLRQVVQGSRREAAVNGHAGEATTRGEYDDNNNKNDKNNEQSISSLKEALEIWHHTAAHQQTEALDDFRSAVARRQGLQTTCRAARASKALHDAFCIGYQGPFATINGLRLGAEATIPAYADTDNHHNDNSPTDAFKAATTTTTVKVPWSEINAALGLLALLLACLEEKPYAGVRYTHKIMPLGSTSKIGHNRNANNNNASNASWTFYNLHSDDSFQFFGRRQFNTALQSLVQCVAEATRAIQRRDPTIHLPHPLAHTNEWTVGGLPVAYGADGVEWTRAMKYLLTNVKHLTAYRAFGLWDVVLDH